jgi:Flavodoxin domain
MNAIVVYESMYGNTRRVAQAIGEGLGGATVVSVHEEPADLQAVDLIVVGGPTHMHGLATSLSRRMAAEAGQEDGTEVEPGATEGPGLRAWMHGLPHCQGTFAAAFDTRLDRSTALTGTAAQAIGRRLRRRGYRVLSTGSFLVEDSVGPLEDGELDRARRWGAELAHSVAVPAPSAA